MVGGAGPVGVGPVSVPGVGPLGAQVGAGTRHILCAHGAVSVGKRSGRGVIFLLAEKNTRN